ncbi:hypothetical protein IDSSA_0126810 [Staphylococcus aureus]
MTTTFIISYIILALIIVGVINLFLIKIKKKRQTPTKGTTIYDTSIKSI